jgi:hypothetical protein
MTASCSTVSSLPVTAPLPTGYRIALGWQTAPLNGVTLPQFLHAYFISTTIGAQTWRGSPVVAPQYLHV